MIKLNEIYEKFLSDDALMQINVQKDPIKKIELILKEENFEELEKNLFKEISDEVNSLMRDTLSRFRESTEYEDYRNSFNSENKQIPFSPVLDSNNLPRKSVSDVLKNLFMRRDSTSSVGSSSSTRSKKRGDRKRGGSGSSVETEQSQDVEYAGLSDFKM